MNAPPRRVVPLLASAVALMMTGAGIVMPVFGRRMGELDGGVEELGLMLFAFAGAQLVMAPLAGRLADRIGRRPLILVGLVSFVITNLLYLVASTPEAIIAVRGVGGAFTAGLLPASLAMVGDTAEPHERGRWAGLVMGSYSVGFVLGPAVGGVLYDTFGFASPFVASAALGLIGAVVGWYRIPETRPVDCGGHTGPAASWRLPRPLTPLMAVLMVQFAPAFAFSYVESEMVFHVYDVLGFSTLDFGLVVGAYGLALFGGQVGLGGLSDRWGRRATLCLGLALVSTFYVGVPRVEVLPPMLALALVAGLGNGLVATAVGAWLLDLAEDDNRTFVTAMGSAASSLASVLGPAAIVASSSVLGTDGVFAAGLTSIGVALAVAVVASPRHRPAGVPVPQARAA